MLDQISIQGVMFYNVQSARPLYLLSSFFDWCALGATADANPFLEGSLVAPWWLLGGSLVAPWWLLGRSLVPPWRLLAPLDLVPGPPLET